MLDGSKSAIARRVFDDIVNPSFSGLVAWRTHPRMHHQSLTGLSRWCVERLSELVSRLSRAKRPKSQFPGHSKNAYKLLVAIAKGLSVLFRTLGGRCNASQSFCCSRSRGSRANSRRCSGSLAAAMNAFTASTVVIRRPPTIQLLSTRPRAPREHQRSTVDR